MSLTETMNYIEISLAGDLETLRSVELDISEYCDIQGITECSFWNEEYQELIEASNIEESSVPSERLFDQTQAYFDSLEVNEHKVYLADSDLSSQIVDTIQKRNCQFKIQGIDSNIDWVSSWKQYYSPVHFNGLSLYPNWFVGGGPFLENADKDNSKGQLRLNIIPGQAFGTGTHETTKLCLESLLFYVNEMNIDQKILDYGCGSGILNLAACRLIKDHYLRNQIHANVIQADFYDIDTEALNNTHNNINENIGIKSFYKETSYRVLSNARELLFGEYNLVFANILTPILIQESQKIVKSLNKNSILILSGFLKNEFDIVLNKFRLLEDFKELNRSTMNEWGCLTLLRV